MEIESLPEKTKNKKALLCSQIISNNTNETTQTPNSKGHLFLSGIEGLKKSLLLQNKITSILTIMNTWSYNYNNIPLKITQSHTIKTHKFIDLHDHQQQSIYDHFNTSIQFIKFNLQKGNVLVHCLMGASRSASVVLAFLMKEKKMRLNEAFQYVKKRRGIVQPNEGFWKDLERFQKEIFCEKNEEQSQMQQN